VPALKSFLPPGAARLSSGPHPDRARQDAETLLFYVLGKNRAWLIAHADDELSEAQAARFLALIERRHRGEPIQHITGEQEFYGLPFRVTPDVLIPRPETEHLVEKALELAATFTGSGHIGSATIGSVSGHDFSRAESSPNDDRASAPANSGHPRILDVGTGSGAIAVALAHNLPHAQITAVDISAQALEIARANATRNGVADRIRFIESDLLAAVELEKFKVVLSNPPYIPTADRDSLSVEVRGHEPALALFAGEDGLDVYRRLIPQAFAVLEPRGYLLMEIGYGQSAAVARLLDQAGFMGIEFVPDLQGILRVVCGRRP
jgi:release factor glutamine methyltransferase